MGKKKKKDYVENPGIDPGTSRMLSERSTIWANSPPTRVICKNRGFIIYLILSLLQQVFSPGYGTQMMLSDQESSFQVRGMMNEVARSVLTPQELNTFNYYVDQYDQNSLSVDDLVTPMLHLLTTPEKVNTCYFCYGVLLTLFTSWWC